MEANIGKKLVLGVASLAAVLGLSVAVTLMLTLLRYQQTLAQLLTTLRVQYQENQMPMFK